MVIGFRLKLFSINNVNSGNPLSANTQGLLGFTVPSYLVIFFCTLISVLAVGVEVRAIARYQISLAVGSAAFIAGGQLVAMRLVPSSTNLLDNFSYIGANCIGIGIGIGISFALHRGMALKTNKFETPLSLCEGKEICPFTTRACPKDSALCPIMRLLHNAGISA